MLCILPMEQSVDKLRQIVNRLSPVLNGLKKYESTLESKHKQTLQARALQFPLPIRPAMISYPSATGCHFRLREDSRIDFRVEYRAWSRRLSTRRSERDVLSALPVYGIWALPCKHDRLVECAGSAYDSLKVLHLQLQQAVSAILGSGIPLPRSAKVRWRPMSHNRMHSLLPI